MALEASALRPSVLARWGVPAVALLGAAGAVAAVDRRGVLLTTYAELSPAALTADLAAGLGLIGAGVVVWSVRPGPPGLLVVALGCLWSASDWIGAEHAPTGVRDAATVAAAFLPALVLHLAVGWPGGSVDAARARALVVAGHAVTAGVALALAVLRDPLFDRYCWRTCTPGTFVVRSDVGAAQLLEGLQLWTAVVLCLAAAAVCTRRLLRAGSPARAELLPVLVPGLVLAVTHAGYEVLLLVVPGLEPDRGPFPALFGLRAAAAVLLAAGLVWWAVRRWRTRAAVLRLARELAEAPAPGDLRTVLARSLGDERLRVGYWLDGPACLVDEVGRPVDLEPAGDQAVTRIERHGRQVAVVVHGRRRQEEGEELQRAIGSAARLAVDNERLRAEVLFRLADLRASQARVVARADARRRALERDLHDGAQQRLLTVLLELRLALTDAGEHADPGLAVLLGSASREAATALAELRALAHGIFPAILTDAGLGPALRTLADGAALPVDVLEVADGRWGAAAETAAYVAVVEAVGDAARRSAGWVTVRVARRGATLLVDVRDDGAARAEGCLVHVADRVGALGGRLTTGASTLLAEIPCG